MSLDELQELFDKESDGRLSDDDRKRLDELLADPARRSAYDLWRRAAGAGSGLSAAGSPDRGFGERVMARLAQGAAPSPEDAPGPLVQFLRWCARPRTLQWNPIGAAALGAVVLAAGAVLVPDATTTAPPAATATTAATVRLVYYGQAGHVTVAGTFNDWSTEAAPMKQVRPGVWSIEIPVSSGRHEYAFVLDGTRWVADPAAPVHVDDGFGQTNARLEI